MRGGQRYSDGAKGFLLVFDRPEDGGPTTLIPAAVIRCTLRMCNSSISKALAMRTSLRPHEQVSSSLRGVIDDQRRAVSAQVRSRHAQLPGAGRGVRRRCVAAETGPKPRKSLLKRPCDAGGGPRVAIDGNGRLFK